MADDAALRPAIERGSHGMRPQAAQNPNALAPGRQSQWREDFHRSGGFQKVFVLGLYMARSESHDYGRSPARRSMDNEMSVSALPSHVRDYLRDQKKLTLATASPGAMPHATTLFYVNDGPALYVWTRPDTT